MGFSMKSQVGEVDDVPDALAKLLDVCSLCLSQVDVQHGELHRASDAVAKVLDIGNLSSAGRCSAR